MSGHSKWSTIKRQKGANDAKRGQLFTKLANAITVAVREGGGGDPAANFKLRLAIEKAKAVNMPRDNIDRAIERGLGKSGGVQLETTVYEGFGPAGTAVMVEAVTDNKNRTTAEVKMAFDKSGGAMSQPGTVAWQFEPVGVIRVKRHDGQEDTITLKAIDAGAQDIDVQDEVLEIYTKPEELHRVNESLRAEGIETEDAELIQKPKQLKEIENPADAHKVIAFLDRLEGLDDVNTVYINAQINDDLIA